MATDLEESPAPAPVDNRPATVRDLQDFIATVMPAIQQVGQLVPQIGEMLNRIGQMVQTLLDAHPMCIVCVQEQQAAARAGVSPEYLPPVNFANAIKDGNSVCGNHFDRVSTPKLYVPGMR